MKSSAFYQERLLRWAINLFETRKWGARRCGWYISNYSLPFTQSWIFHPDTNFSFLCLCPWIHRSLLTTQSTMSMFSYWPTVCFSLVFLFLIHFLTVKDVGIISLGQGYLYYIHHSVLWLCSTGTVIHFNSSPYRSTRPLIPLRDAYERKAVSCSKVLL